MANASIFHELFPIAVYTVEDGPVTVENNLVDGIGDDIYSTILAYVRGTPQSSVLAGFHLYELPPSLVSQDDLISAGLQGSVIPNGLSDTGVRDIDILIFESAGVPRPEDFQTSAAKVGSVSYHPPPDISVGYDLDVTSELRSLVTPSFTHLGVRFEAANFQGPSVASSSFNSARLVVEIVPEPTSKLLAFLGLTVFSLSAGRKFRG